MNIQTHLQLIDETIEKFENEENYEECQYWHELKQSILNKDVKTFIELSIDVDDLIEAGFLNKDMDYTQISKRITTFFGIKSIFEYSLFHKGVHITYANPDNILGI